jgi:WD40 repeat protein
VKLAFESWEFGAAAATELDLTVKAPPSGPKLEAISSRLRQSLQHPTRTGSMRGLRYSPDGRRIVAGNYESGVIQFWDVATGRQLTHIDAGPDNLSAFAGPPLSSDWSVLYATNGSRSNYTRIERDGRWIFRWEFDGTIRVWDVATGTLRDEWRHTPPRRELLLRLSPDGKSLISTEQLPGEMTTPQVPRTATLWNTETKRGRDLPQLEGFDAVFSPDSRTIAMAKLTNASDASKSVNVIDAATATIIQSISIAEPNTVASLSSFTPDGRVLVGVTRTLTDLRNPKSWKFAARFWDAQSGTQLLNEPLAAMTSTSLCLLSPDGRTFVVPGAPEDKCLLYVLQVPERRLRSTIDLASRSFVRTVAFSPDSRWLAVVTQARSENGVRDPKPEELPQPRIHLVEVATGRVRETLVAPQAFPESACFSPDGKTLATGGRGKVHLWDVSDLK